MSHQLKGAFPISLSLTNPYLLLSGTVYSLLVNCSLIISHILIESSQL